MTSGSPKWSPLRIQKRESGLSASMSDSAAAKSSPMIRLSSTGDIYAVGDDGLVDLSKPTLSPKVTEKLPSNSESRGSMLSVVQGGNGKESRKTSRTYGFVQTNKLVSGSIFKQGEAFPTSLLVTGKQSDSVLGSVFGGAKGTLAEAGNKPDPSTTRVGGLGIGLAPSVGNNEGIENLDPVQSALRKTSNSSLNSNKSGSRRSSTSAELDLPNGSDQSSKKQRHAETLNAGATWPKSSLTSSASLPASPARRGLAGPRQPATSRSASQIDGQASELSASSSSAFALCVAVNAARTRPRRKTVTWASREDVLEFDDDDNASAGVRTASWTSQTSSEGDSAERETLGNPTDISSDGQISPDVRDAAAESMQDISSCYSPKKSILQDSLSSSAGSRPLPVAPIVTHATYEVNSTSLDIQPAVLASEEYSLPDLAMYSPLLGSDFAFDAAEEPYQPSTSPALTKERVQQRVRERRAAIGSPEESSECLVRQGTLVRDDAGIATRPAMRAREATVSDDLIRQLPGEAPLGSPLSQHLSGAQSALDRLAATHAFVSSSRGASIQSSDQVYFSGDPSRACTSTPAATFVTNIEKGNGRVLDLSTRSTANDFHEGTTDALDSVCNSADKSYRIKEIKRGWYGVEAASPSPSTSQDLSPGSPAPWRRVRTPQDLYQYPEDLRAYARVKPERHGRVLMKLDKVCFEGLPMPLAPVQLVCTMSNGSTSVTTPKFNVAQTVTLAQDFELIEHRGLEFSLTFETTMDNEAIRPGTPTSQPGTPTRSSPAGIKRFFANSSPKKVKSGAILDPFMLYLSPSGTLAGTKVIYDEIADRCFGTKCTFQYPLVSPNPERREVLGYIQIEIFFLPAMPKHVKLPQTVDQCYKGLRAALAYHQTQYKGHLSQMGGDCHVWRRRQFHLQGSRLVAFNDVTKQAHAIVDLSMMISLEDTDDEQVARKIERTNDDDERAYVANSFRCLFRDGSEISFYADTADEKRDWMEVLAKIEKDTFTFGPWAECLVFDLRLEDARRAVHVAQLEAAKDSVDGDSLYS